MSSSNPLLAAVAAGDRQAFEVLFKKYYPKTLSMLVGIIKDRFIAENVAQDLFMNIWINREKLSEIKSFDSYIYVSARHAAINNICTDAVIPLTAVSGDISTDDNTAEDDVLINELRQIIAAEIDKMPAQRRKVFIMSRMQGMTIAQISESLSISSRTAERHINMALASLKKVEYLLLLMLMHVK